MFGSGPNVMRHGMMFHPDRLFDMLGPEQALTKTRPAGSLEKAIKLAQMFYPTYDILTALKHVPMEPLFPWDAFTLQMSRRVLLVFLNKYHEHVMRHGIYLQVGY